MVSLARALPTAFPFQAFVLGIGLAWDTVAFSQVPVAERQEAALPGREDSDASGGRVLRDEKEQRAAPQSDSSGLPPARKPVRSAKSAEEPANQSWRHRYELGFGDELNFALQGFPKLTRTKVPVEPDGTVSYLQARHVQVLGKTIDELRREMASILVGYHRDPRLIITPATLGSKRYTVLGEVRQNGTYPLEQPVNLLQALAKAGGINAGTNGQIGMELADLRRSFIVRHGHRLEVDMEALYRRGDLSENIDLEPDDYVYIASFVRNEVYIFGQVREPGVRGIEPGMTSLGAVSAAGGFAPGAWRDRVLIVRGRMDHPVTKVVQLNQVLHGHEPDELIEPGDIVFVNLRPWAYATQILDSAIVAYLNGFAVGAVQEGGGIATPTFRSF